jgi:tetratricopeptide (TPR) repeat protein
VFRFLLLGCCVTLCAAAQNPGRPDDPSASPMQIRGKVVLEDGSPPPSPPTVRSICMMVPLMIHQTVTDKRGQFAISLGAAYTEMYSMPCELTVTLKGYRPATVRLAAHDGEIADIVLEAIGTAESKTISVSSAAAPTEAKAAYERARQAILKGDARAARGELAHALEVYPKYPLALTMLGRLQMDAGDHVAARQSLQKSIEAEPSYLPPYERLAILALLEQNWSELARVTDRVIQLGAYAYPQMYYYNAQANVGLDHLDAAERSAQDALKVDPKQFIRANYLLGLIYARRGDLASSVDRLKIYLASSPADAEPIRKQLADFEKRLQP